MSIEAKLGKAALDRAMQNSSGSMSPSQSTTNSFQNVLESQTAGQEMVDMLGMGQTEISPAASMQSIDANAINIDPASVNVGLETPQGGRKIVQMLSEVNKGQMQMDTMVNQILYSGKRFSNQELLAIQAHVFHFAQMTELTVKVAEQGVSAVKNIQNTQIQ